MPQLGVAIFVVVAVNGVFAFAQEQRAEQAAERLRDLLPARARVVRDGRPAEIDAADLVVGDLVLLTPGDRVSADLELARGPRPAGRHVDAHRRERARRRSSAGEPASPGTFVVEGEAAGVVAATGARTRLAGIAH